MVKGGLTFATGSPTKKIFSTFFKKMTFLGVILCEKSIARIPEA